MPGNPFSQLVQGCCFPAPFPPYRIPELSVECVYRAPPIYNVQWSLESWDYEGNVMRAVRRPVVEKEGGETVSYDVPVLWRGKAAASFPLTPPGRIPWRMNFMRRPAYGCRTAALRGKHGRVFLAFLSRK